MKLTYVGGTIALIGDRWPQGGLARVTVDGSSRTVSVRSVRAHARQVLLRVALAPGRHTLAIRVLHGVFPLEAVAITNRVR